MANLLAFGETRDGKMEIKMTNIHNNKFNTDYEVVSVLGEGSFG